jgi:hypothetical protein
MSKRISTQQIAYFRYELEKGNAKRKKGVLQDICAIYRRGLFLPLEAVEVFETLINGLLLQENQDLKVVRWCLNALAQFGRINSSRPYVEAALKKYAGDPEIEAAGVAALCYMYRGSVADIKALAGIDPVIWKLAALQNTDPSKIELDSLSINIDKAEPAVLRLALITVGLNRDIENLFHPKHSNSVFVRRLGQHPDDVVQQYSVWSVIENRKLVFDDLGVSLDDIDALRPNVQSKLYQLVAERDPDPHRRLEITARGSSVAPEDAREGLAKGVKRNFYDGLEGITLDWYGQEKNLAVRGDLAEHFAKFAELCPAYGPMVMRINEEDPRLRDRLLVGAEGTPLYSKLKAVETADLFAEMEDVFDLGRAIRDQQKAADARPKRKVLLLAASPLDASRLRLEQEQRDIKGRLKILGTTKVDLDIVIEPAVRAHDILTSILGSEADVFHFSGHGEIDGLIFESESGQSKKVDGAHLASHLKRIKKTLRCLVLNACFSDRLARNLAPHVEVMVGCNAEIDDDAAITFASAFYVAMASGYSYAECYEIAVNDVKINHSLAEAKKYVIRRKRKR